MISGSLSTVRIKNISQMFRGGSSHYESDTIAAHSLIESERGERQQFAHVPKSDVEAQRRLV
jgi:hypothetical protein